MLLDGWVIQGTIANYVPITVGDLIAADPEYIYIGHGHFDHAGNSGVIAEATGASIIGTAEHCDGAKSTATEPDKVRCISIVDAAGSEFRGVNGSLAIARYPGSPTDFAHFASSQSMDEGGSVVYRFDWGAFSLLWNDTVGPVAVPREVGAEEILGSLRKLGPVDLQVGAIQGFDMLTNGLKDVRLYVEAVRPKVYIPSHHDNWLPPNVTSGAAYYQPLVDELDRIPFAARPRLCFINDPDNYQSPFVFKAGEWTGVLGGAVPGCWKP